MYKYLIVFIFIVVFIGSLCLGVWQIKRGYEKKELENIFSDRQSLPVNSEVQSLSAELFYRNIQILGSFKDDLFYIDNKIFNGDPGLLVISSFSTLDGLNLLVSRGWIESLERNSFPEVSIPPGEVNIPGLLRPISKDYVISSKQFMQEGRKFLLQGIDLRLMEKLSNRKYLPYVFELSGLSKYSFEPIWKPASMKSSMHFGYAVQWFAISLVVLFGGFYLYKKRQK